MPVYSIQAIHGYEAQEAQLQVPHFLKPPKLSRQISAVVLYGPHSQQDNLNLCFYWN